MSRTTRRKTRRAGKPIPLQVRSQIARAAWDQTGSGAHGKSRKAERRADRIAIQKGDIA